jgi:hypothetical protein
MRHRSDLCRRCQEVTGKRVWRLASGRRDSVAGSLWLEDRSSGDREEVVRLTARFDGLGSFSFYFIFFIFFS